MISCLIVTCFTLKEFLHAFSVLALGYILKGCFRVEGGVELHGIPWWFLLPKTYFRFMWSGSSFLTFSGPYAKHTCHDIVSLVGLHVGSLGCMFAIWL